MAGVGWVGLGHRPAFFPVVFALLGVVVGPLVEAPGWPWAVAGFAGLVGAALRGGRVGAVLLLAVGCAGAGGWLATTQAATWWPETATDGALHVLEGELESLAPTDDGQLATLAVSHIDSAAARGRVSVAIRGERRLSTGQRVSLRSRLVRTAEARNPGEASRTVWRSRRGLELNASTTVEAVVALTPPARRTQWLEERRQELATAAEQTIDDVRARGLVLTLAAGQRSELSEDLEEAFSRSGLAHVLSVSGLHVAALALALFMVLRWVALRIPWRRLRRLDPRQLAAPAAVPLVWAYVAFTGWQAPAVRSAVMTTVVLAGQLLARRSDGLNTLSLAALAMLTVDPAAPFDLSVQLSFVAAMAMVTLAPAMAAPLRGDGSSGMKSTIRTHFVQTMAASVAVTAACAPLIVGAFGRASLAGLFSNVVALPVCGALVLCSAGAAAMSVALPSCAKLVLWLAGWLAKGVIGLAELFSRAPGASLELPTPPWWGVLTFWAALAMVVLASGRWRWLGLAAPGLAAALAFSGAPRSDMLEVTFLSVGHGDAVVVSAGGRHLLIDAGGVPQGADTGLRFVLPYLRQRQIRALELAVLSHAHPDHGLGLVSVLQAIPTKRLWLANGTTGGGLVDDIEDAADGAAVEHVGAGTAAVMLGGVRVEVLGPTQTSAAGENENNRSVVLKLTHGAVTFLLTGDIEEDAERALKTGQVTVLKAPHHGSSTSSTVEFVEQAHPTHVVFSVGMRNRFNFPRPDVVARYAAIGSQMYRTDVDGAVTFVSDGRQVEVTTYAGEPKLSLRARRSQLRR